MFVFTRHTVKAAMMIRNQNCKLAAAAAVLLPLAAPVRADSGWGLLNMTPGVTDISRKKIGRASCRERV